MLRGDGPFKVLEKVNNNSCKLEFPADMGGSPTFNIGDLTPYRKDEDNGDHLRENHNQKPEDEVNAMPISVRESSQVLSTQTLHHMGFGPCTNLELQFRVHPKPLGSITLLFWQGQEAF